MSILFHRTMAILSAVVGLAVILYALRGAATKRPHDVTMKRLAIGYRSAMDLTVFLGLVVIMTHHGGFPTTLGMHVVAMLLATAIAHVVPMVMRKRPQEERTLLPYAVATAISLGVGALGVTVILS